MKLIDIKHISEHDTAINHPNGWEFAFQQIWYTPRAHMRTMYRLPNEMKRRKTYIFDV